EQVTSIYLEILLKAKLAGGDDVVAVTYVADRRHHQYAGRLEREDLLRLVRQGKGMSGDNPAYIINTYDHLRSIGVADKTLKWLIESLQQA
ncbi:MAG: gamma-glutamyl cyclotransferase, partial [Hyphomicrobiales bacterium]|nr:gamma-glutamyl cyclotransferase [Hyphomicrobiales bacterium]